MKPPLIRKSGPHSPGRRDERGVTIVLVALTMIAIMAMAALSIDVVTLYLANAEAQRSADAAALAGARMLSIAGMTADPNNAGDTWEPACAFAAKVATAVAEQNTVGGAALINTQVTVTFPNNSDTAACSGNDAAFGVNPLVTVKVQRTNVPTFFARIWGQTGASVSGTATAEAFNSSNSDNVGNGGPTGTVTPVQPRCVRPWIVPDSDPGLTSLGKFITNDGAIQTQGIRLNGAGTGVAGETFDLLPDCQGTAAPCTLSKPTPVATHTPTATLQYLPGEVPATSTAVPACATGSAYEEAVAGCDQTTVYQCGVNSSTAPTPNRLDLNENPAGGDTSNGVQCLINQASGQDTLDTSVYPYHIKAGAGSPLVGAGLSSGSTTTSSPSIVTLPIYDSSASLAGGLEPPVTIVGFLQVFINQDNGGGSVNVTVLNVSGCGNGSEPVGTAVSGTSPIPVRLITYP